MAPFRKGLVRALELGQDLPSRPAAVDEAEGELEDNLKAIIVRTPLPDHA